MTTFKKISLFGMVGVVNTLVDLAVVNVSILLSSLMALGFPYALSRTMGFVAALVVSYVLNRRYVFVGRTSDSTAPIRFALVTLVTFLVSVASSTVAFNMFSLHAGVHIAGTLAALVGSGIGATVNFFGYDTVVFRPKKSESFIRTV